MTWSLARKLDAAIQAPFGLAFLAPDTRVLDRPGWRQIVTPSAARGVLNEVGYSVLSKEEAEPAIDLAVATYHGCGQPVKWYVGPWTRPADFGERLSRRGFQVSELRGMGCPTDMTVNAPSDVSVIEASSEDGVDEFMDVSARGWSMDLTALNRPMHVAVLTSAPRIVHFFVARMAGVAVGSACLILRDDYGYLMGTQVIESARGRGVYKALVHSRLAFLRARGFEYAVIQAMEATAAPILLHLGFETLFHSRCYRLEPPKTPLV
jgi:hypothetical protein